MAPSWLEDMADNTAAVEAEMDKVRKDKAEDESWLVDCTLTSFEAVPVHAGNTQIVRNK